MTTLPALKEAFMRLVPLLRITSADDFYVRGREYGYDFPRRAFREAWRAINEETGYRYAIANLPSEARVPAAWMRTTVDPRLDKYTYIQNITVEHSTTGYRHVIRGFITTNRPMSLRAAEEEFKRRVADSPTWVEWRIVGKEWVGAYRQK